MQHVVHAIARFQTRIEAADVAVDKSERTLRGTGVQKYLADIVSIPARQIVDAYNFLAERK
jgi:hypothetical protein